MLLVLLVQPPSAGGIAVPAPPRTMPTPKFITQAGQSATRDRSFFNYRCIFSILIYMKHYTNIGVKTGVLALFGLLMLTVPAAGAGLDLSVDVELNEMGFNSFDHFTSLLHLVNGGEALEDINIGGVLEVAGSYYFWPEYNENVYFRMQDVPTGHVIITLLELDFPDLSDFIPFGPMFFYGAWLGGDTEWGYDVEEFWLDPARRRTPTHAPTPLPTRTPAPSPGPSLTPVPTASATRVPIVMVTLAPGTFTMGSPASPVPELCRHSDERQHGVTLSREFAVQRTEVTQWQWMQVFSTYNPSYFQDPDNPVENISWFDVLVFCNRSSGRDGLTPCYYTDEAFTMVFDAEPPVDETDVFWNTAADGYRLPTESEWEYACRATSTGAYNMADNTDCFDDPALYPYAWFAYTSNTGYGMMPHTVGTLDPNLWALYDMHGNVSEWTWDWYWDYPFGPVVDPSGPEWGIVRAVRGGAYNYSAQLCRSAYRGTEAPGGSDPGIGFRLARFSSPVQQP
ncbi:SUMF1/EgtB/PvdO family nonheme iron enzyme [bacterium]|nr:SUMF1/EgtB/PvdO family nonheme iron enzyme [candidate division CSSED10-310 bacterium]